MKASDHYVTNAKKIEEAVDHLCSHVVLAAVVAVLLIVPRLL